MFVTAAGMAVVAFDVGLARRGFQHEDVHRVVAYSPVPLALMLVAMGVSSPVA